MAELMGGGLNEYGGYKLPDDQMMNPERFRRNIAQLPAELQDPKSWPIEMQREIGDDWGTTAAAIHREKVVESFRVLRKEIDDFKPDAILIWSKEQLENFGPDAMPPFCIYAYDDFKIKRFEDTEMDVHIHRQAAKHLAAKLTESGFDVAYSYKPLHIQLAHTFAGLITYLNWDKQGLPYPIIPFYVNSFGHWHLTRDGYSRPDELDVPPPPPWRCFDLGAATARILKDSPWRVVILAGSSWSHASYMKKTSFLWPDVDFDRALFADLKTGNYKAWRNLDREALWGAGNQEFMSWVCLAGALDEAGLKPVYLESAETWIFNSTKVTAVFK